mmetsp:Transcript_59591/g.98808  ORF Transcript_59591/g.98808 Transcript_59591/m.98808 type:complete len:92 (+) Transcript_59591:64-339(+)
MLHQIFLPVADAADLLLFLMGFVPAYTTAGVCSILLIVQRYICPGYVWMSPCRHSVPYCPNATLVLSLWQSHPAESYHSHRYEIAGSSSSC